MVTEPWPSMLRTIWGDDERYQETYWSRFARQGYYFAGDGAKRDDDGAIWLLGRVDDVMNVSGHRLSTAEIESALVSHPSVAEAAVVGAADETTGQAVVAFVILRESAHGSTRAPPTSFASTWPGRSGPSPGRAGSWSCPNCRRPAPGKIMRRLLRDVAEDREVGDATTLADGSVMDLIASRVKAGAPED